MGEHVAPAPAGGSYLGGFVSRNMVASGGPDPLDANAIDRFESKLGQHLDIAIKFVAFSNLSFPTSEAQLMQSRKGVLLIKVEPWSFKGKSDQSYSLADIAAGKYDYLIEQFASAAKAYGGPVMMSFGHEMNVDAANQWYPWQGNPDLYKKACQHFFDVLARAGATNITRVWNPNINDIQSIAPYFPGANYVDWVTVDGYNNISSGQWRSPAELFTSSLSELKTMGITKPVAIFETASDPIGGDKPTWEKQLVDYTVAHQLKALIWFDQDKSDGQWAVTANARPLETAALKAALDIHRVDFASDIVLENGSVSASSTPASTPVASTAKNLAVASVEKLGEHDGTITAMITFDLGPIPAQVTLLKAYIHTDQDYIQNDQQAIPYKTGQTQIAVKAYLSHDNATSPFVIRGYDASGKQIYEQAVSVALPK